MLVDLFNEIPVSQPEIDAWLREVARLDPASPRSAWYVKAYNVPDKIRAEKARQAALNAFCGPLPRRRVRRAPSSAQRSQRPHPATR